MAKKPFRFEPIRPKKPVVKVSLPKVFGTLTQFAVAVISKQTRYPAKPARIKRRRTGEYGRRWTMRPPRPHKLGLMVQVGSNLEYAPYVGGLKKGGKKKDRQAKSTAAIGWTSVEIVGQDEWKKIRPVLIAALAGK